jgi:L-lactate dehydrogenase complex protein LldE
MGNAGFEHMAKPLAKKFDELFSPYDYVVAPSASCAAYVRCFHPNLLGKKIEDCEAAGKTMDIVEFLHDVVKVDCLPARFPHKVSVHNSCHGVRELGLSSPSERNVPRFNKMIDLLRLVDGIEVVEPDRPDECCGFGGMFAVEEQAVSRCMGIEKVRRHVATGAAYVTGPDSSCLMHMQGVAEKEGINIKFIHVAQILAAGL